MGSGGRESKEYSRMEEVREQPGQGVPGLEDSASSARGASKKATVIMT